MATHYLPVAGQIRVVDGLIAPKKYPLPTSPRSFPSGTVLWNNKDSGVEPALNRAADTVNTTVDLANAALVTAGVVGIAMEQRVPQQFASTGQFAAGGAAAAYSEDASRPFITAADECVCVAPYNDTLTGATSLAAQHEIGEYVQLDGFVNEGTTGFYNSSGTLVKDTYAYLYNNAVKISVTQDAAHSIGVLCQRALIGATELRFKLFTNTI